MEDLQASFPSISMPLHRLPSVYCVQGTALHSHTHTILQPLFRLRLETWADFSTRLPAQQVRTTQLWALTRMSSGGE